MRRMSKVHAPEEPEVQGTPEAEAPADPKPLSPFHPLVEDHLTMLAGGCKTEGCEACKPSPCLDCDRPECGGECCAPGIMMGWPTQAEIRAAAEMSETERALRTPIADRGLTEEQKAEWLKRLNGEDE